MSRMFGSGCSSWLIGAGVRGENTLECGLLMIATFTLCSGKAFSDFLESAVLKNFSGSP